MQLWVKRGMDALEESSISVALEYCCYNYDITIENTFVTSERFLVKGSEKTIVRLRKCSDNDIG